MAIERRYYRAFLRAVDGGLSENVVNREFGLPLASRTLSNGNKVTLHYFKKKSNLYLIVERDPGGRFLRTRSKDNFGRYKDMSGMWFFENLGPMLDPKVDAMYLNADLTINPDKLRTQHPELF